MSLVLRINIHKTDGEALVETSCGKYLISLADFGRGGFAEGAELDEKSMDFLEAAHDKLACIKKAFVYLSYRGLSVRAMRTKLKKASFGEKSIDAAVALLCDRGYLNDEALCADTAKALASAKNFGPSRLRTELYAKGFERDCIDVVLADMEFNEETPLHELIKKKFPNYVDGNYDARRKIVAYLARMGYGYDAINNALESYGRE